MLARAKHKCPPPVVGSTVQVPIPEVDQGPLDPLFVICCVVDIKPEKSLYQLGNKHGLLDTWLPINGFGVCAQILINISEVNREKAIGLREMARLCSIANGQGYIKCGCTKSCDRKCKCKQNNQICNSRCHGKKANKNCKNC